jgi:hypothetical protein
MKRVFAAVFALLFSVISLCGCTASKYEKLYISVLEDVSGPDDDRFDEMSPERRNLFVVMTFDMEIQNGGLEQFFWNTEGKYASLLADSLRAVGLDDIAKLYDDFISANLRTEEWQTSIRSLCPD